MASPRLFGALLLLALGFQVHFGLSSAPRYLQLAPREQLPYLMPVFWIGFNLLMFPAARVVKRLGPADAMALAAPGGATATPFAPIAQTVPLLCGSGAQAAVCGKGFTFVTARCSGRVPSSG